MAGARTSAAGAAAPLVSVIIPTFNRERYLREAMESVFAQTFTSWELIVVDDGSTDGTRAYLRSRASARVRSLFEVHCGNPARLRNVGVRESGGSYVAFLDSDDLWASEKLAAQVDDLRAHPDCGWSYSDVSRIDEHGNPVGPSRPPRLVPYSGWILEDIVAARAAIALPSVMVERQVFEAAGGFNEQRLRCEDYDLWIRLAERSRAAAVTTPLTKVRRHPENTRGPRVAVFAHLDAIHAELRARTDSPAVRRLCDRRRVELAIEFTDRFRWIGRHAEAREVLGASVRFAWRSARWWVGAIKTWVRPALPGFVLTSLLARAERAAGRQR